MAFHFQAPVDVLWRWESARVECYSGYREDETPCAVILGGIVFPLAEIISRRRECDAATGAITETFECRLEAGWAVSLARLEDGTWRIRRKSLSPRFDSN